MFLLRFKVFIVFSLFGALLLRAQSYSDSNDNLKMPFEATSVSSSGFAKGTKWYTIRTHTGKYWTVFNNKVVCVSDLTSFDESNYFCFEGDNVNGFHIYNKALGPEYIIYSTTNTASSLTPTLKVNTSSPNTYKISINGTGYNFYYPNTPISCVCDKNGAGTLCHWVNINAPKDENSRMYIELVDEELLEADVYPQLVSVKGDVYYVYAKNGDVDAFPASCLNGHDLEGTTISFTSKEGTKYEYQRAEVDSVSFVAPSDFPTILSFKFNNKFNDMLFVDADGTISEDNHIYINVGGIGKRLVPSIKTSGTEDLIYVGDELQTSKETSRRFTSPTRYTVTKPGYKMLREYKDGSFAMLPFGNDYVVNVNYLADHPTTSYGLPEIRIKTNDGTIISSKSIYKDATISINGAGFLPDMEETAMQIRGRGNTSWTYVSTSNNPKNPYLFKFEEKQKPLGMTAGKSWVLLANKIDGSLTANSIAFRASEMLGCASANHCIPVELYINGSYRGQYNLTEKVGISNNSVDLDDETNAAMLELDTYYDETYRFKSAKYALPVNIKEPDFDDEVQTTNLTQSMISDSFNAFVTALYQGKGSEDYVDSYYLARFLIANELVMNRDIKHPRSTFCYNPDITDPQSKYIFGPVWDFDWGFGYDGDCEYFVHNTQTHFYNINTAFKGSPFIYDLRYNSGETLNREYYAVLKDFVTNHLSDLLEYCDDYYALTAKSIRHDNQKWSHATDYGELTARCKDWLVQRSNYMLDYASNTLGYRQLYDRDVLYGDVNGDGVLTIADVVAIINYLNNVLSFNFDSEAADANRDGKITTEDAEHVINILLNR